MRNLLPIVLIVIAIGLFFLYISPAYGQVETLMTQKSDYATALAKAADVGVLRDQLLTKYNSFSQDNLARLNTLVPDSVNTVKLVTDLNSVASAYGITISKVTVTDQVADNGTSVSTDQTTSQRPPYNTTNVSFQFSATYPHLVQFLESLEKSLQVVDVTKVSFDVPEDGINTGVYDYTVGVQTYYLNSSAH